MEHLQQQLTGLMADSERLARPQKPGIWNKRSKIVAGLVFAGLLAGCASQDMAPPVAQLARAEASIETAIQAGARDAAPLELQTAQRHLTEAQQANASEEYRRALWFAEKSEADADLAEAKARTEQAYLTVAELQEGIRVLEDELERSSELDAN